MPVRIQREIVWLVLLAVLASVVLLVRLGSAPITESAEERCFEVAAGMYAGQGLLVPYMDGAPRLNKPPLYYWLVFASAKLCGAMSYFSLRLPATLSALCLLVVTACWARALLGAGAGLLAAFLLALMLQFYTLGRRGVAEMPLALFCTLALLAFDAAFFRSARRALPWFALWVLLGFLTKATAALLLIALPIVVTLLVHRSLRRALRWRVAGWITAALGLGLVWYVVIVLIVPGAFDALYSAALLPVGVETQAPAARHYRPVWYYVSEMFIAAAPASLLVPLVAWRAASSRCLAGEPRRRFVAIAFATMFVALSILPQKQKHYLVSLLPLFAILCADALERCYALRRGAFDRCLRWFGVLALALGAVAAALIILFLHVVKGAALAWVLPFALITWLAFAAAAMQARAHQARPCALWFALGMFAILLLHFGGVDPWRREVEAAAEAPAGTATANGRASLAQWQALADHHPLVARLFNVRVHDGAARAQPPNRAGVEDGDDDGS